MLPSWFVALGADWQPLFDRGHPTVQGHWVWADAFKPIQPELLGPSGNADHSPPAAIEPGATVER
jgi:hypothetical protein